MFRSQQVLECRRCRFGTVFPFPTHARHSRLWRVCFTVLFLSTHPLCPSRCPLRVNEKPRTGDRTATGTGGRARSLTVTELVAFCQQVVRSGSLFRRLRAKLRARFVIRSFQPHRCRWIERVRYNSPCCDAGGSFGCRAIVVLHTVPKGCETRWIC